MTQDYRPETWDEIVGQPTDEIQAYIESTDRDNYPNFLFYGPPGTGKTTTAHMVAREIQGSTKDLMEFNASDDRGIDTVRDEIIPATNQTTLTGAPRVIFLDEMDSMTKSAQQALRQPMEQSRSVFVLACNDRDAVHDAIESRCRTYEFGHLSDPAIKTRIEQLADADDADLTNDQMTMIVSFASGDMRGAIQRYEQVVKGVVENNDTTVTTEGFEAEARQFLNE